MFWVNDRAVANGWPLRFLESSKLFARNTRGLLDEIEALLRAEESSPPAAIVYIEYETYRELTQFRPRTIQVLSGDDVLRIGQEIEGRVFAAGSERFAGGIDRLLESAGETGQIVVINHLTEDPAVVEKCLYTLG